MYKLYTIAKKKTGILGLWQDENGKIFRDKINQILIPDFDIGQLNIKKRKLFLQGEKAIFYVSQYTDKPKQAFIEHINGKIETLRHCITWKENKLRPSLIKALLVQHNGLTIYKNKNDYTLEIWKS